MSLGSYMYELAKELFPINRSLTGDGVRETLRILSKEVPIKIIEVPSGTKAFDWTVPDEWNIRDAYVKNSCGERIIDFKKNNLHVVGYSEPVDMRMNLEELSKILYSLPNQPDAIPYVTSYYKRRFGFCISHNDRLSLIEDDYHVHIDSTLAPGSMTYGELLIPGLSKKEILLSTYVCHPSMANNELSGPVVATALAKMIMSLKERNYTYRILFLPETIGSIYYLSQHIDYMKEHVIAGFVLTCVGDNRSYSFVESRYGNTLADRVLKCVLEHHYPEYKAYRFLSRGSDERQYCSPGVDLPVVSFSRSKFGEFEEYHTSMDNLDLISPVGLEGAYNAIEKSIVAIERNAYYKVNVLCEPQLGKRGLYPTESYKGSATNLRDMMNFIAYCDGQNDLLQISERIQCPLDSIYTFVDTLLEAGIIEKVN